MSQTKTMSAVESAAGTAIGFVISWALTPLILALFGYQAGSGTAFGIVAIYTALSFGRTWLVRRLFNWIHHRHDPKPEPAPVFDGRNGNGYQPVKAPKPGWPPEVQRSLNETMEGADVLKQWRNPCVREADADWQRRRFFGADPEMDAEWLANQRLSHNRRRNRP